jgi:hypothetical protein
MLRGRSQTDDRKVRDIAAELVEHARQRAHQDDGQRLPDVVTLRAYSSTTVLAAYRSEAVTC